MGPENVADAGAVRMKIAAIAVAVAAVVEPTVVNVMSQLQKKVWEVCSLERMAVSI